MTASISGSAVRVGRILPIFYLPSVHGGKSGPAATRSKYNLVLTFLPNVQEAATYLQGIAQVYAEILRNDARVIAVLGADLDTTQRVAEALELPFALLADEDGATAARILGGGNRAGLIATDRYGVVYCMEATVRIEELPAPSVIPDWLEYVEMQCPECTDGADKRWSVE
ncbi:MAG: redoxin domain-containing protein [Chloroflexia bacterium]